MMKWHFGKIIARLRKDKIYDVIGMQNAKCRHCGTEMETSELVNLAEGIVFFGAIRDRLPFKEPKPYFLQFLRCPKCGYTEMFFR